MAHITEAMMAAEGAATRMKMGREQRGLSQQEGPNAGVCSKQNRQDLGRGGCSADGPACQRPLGKHEVSEFELFGEGR